MARVNDFYSIGETRKPLVARFHHNNSDCSYGHKTPNEERRQGKGGYLLCDVCRHHNKQELSDHQYNEFEPPLEVITAIGEPNQDQ